MQDTLFHSLLHQAIETHTVSVSEEVRQHGETSDNAEVRAAWAEYQLLERGIAAWRSELPTVDLADRVLADLYPPAMVNETPAADSPALQAFVRQSWDDVRAPANRSGAIAIAVAGILLLLGGLMISTPHSPQAEIAVRSRQPALDDPAVKVTVASVEWAQRASSAMAEMIVSLPERSTDLVPAGQWDMNWKMRLEPLHRDAHAAWESLLEELPMTDDPQS